MSWYVSVWATQIHSTSLHFRKFLSSPFFSTTLHCPIRHSIVYRKHVLLRYLTILYYNTIQFITILNCNKLYFILLYFTSHMCSTSLQHRTTCGMDRTRYKVHLHPVKLNAKEVRWNELKARQWGEDRDRDTNRQREWWIVAGECSVKMPYSRLPGWVHPPHRLNTSLLWENNNWRKSSKTQMMMTWEVWEVER